uniref:Uncharacterized protein n=1 Tax=Romanomermis culicivorax TaxID=13658 RepID=A0A915HZN5_ROMCU
MGLKIHRIPPNLKKKRKNRQQHPLESQKLSGPKWKYSVGMHGAEVQPQVYGHIEVSHQMTK